jgi:hypothetical protein
MRGPVQPERVRSAARNLNPEFRLTLMLNVLGTTPAAANWTSGDGSGEKPDYIMHESLNRSMHFALKETDFDQVAFRPQIPYGVSACTP